MADQLVGIDFETHYSNEYSLRKMTTAEYVLDPRFEIHGVGVTWPDGEVEYIDSNDVLHIRAALAKYDIGNSTVVAHNAIFDGAILEWRLKIKPKRYFCTMMGARPIYASTKKSMSLASLTADYSRMHAKDYTALAATAGLRFDALSPGHRDALRNYCTNDVRLMMRLYQDLDGKLPDDERELLDLTIKKFTRPTLKLDRNLLTKRRDELVRLKEETIKAAKVPSAVLMSNPKLAAELERLGVKRIPMKKSPTTGKMTYAFAKDDQEFLDLLTYPDKDVQQLVKARLRIKSTLELTRTERLCALTSLTRWLPAPLLYYGAHPGRWSGMDGLNLQNLPRGSPLRTAVIAPPGYKVLAGDLSQIEARVLAVLAGCTTLVKQFAADVDVYSKFASKVYGIEVNKDDTPKERFVGKTGILGLGYGLGPLKFHKTIQLAKVNMSLNEAKRVVYTYREVYHQIPALWGTLSRLISEALMVPGSLRVFGPLTFVHEYVALPNSMTLHYPKLTRPLWGTGDNFEFYSPKYGTVGLYGGKLTENIVQALARIILSSAELRLARRGMRAALTVHDELVYVVREDRVQQAHDMVVEELTRPVPWMPNLPLACEVKYGNNYGECK